ncbi:uncharacterized protein LOC111379814 [Olea europaea var. sylvestris]|uniref:uncharacterized protein LOC111379814 n=1 Tax=Olea europaea var. sylvestris TaxID=158386 RepID=UPI000C1D5979|nr:uncharacterized protein LOC111379814 [Olea europaea var. sylvestris]
MGGLPRCALKIDLMKAYDFVRWDFLFAVLRVIGFPERVVRWIIECVTTTRFSIFINGELHGFFAGGRGLRCEKEKITHLCFADDLMVFCRAEVGSVSLIGECLNRFKALSGLIPNPDKSNLFASGVSLYLKDQLLDVLGYKEGVLPVRYLGVPLISTKLRALDCKILMDRIIVRAKSWTCRALSYAGRLQLIKSVLFSIQVYKSSVFLLPKVVIKQVENSLRVFLWKGSNLGTSGAKMA